MNGNIYKLTPSITKEKILQNCEYNDIPDYGDVITYEHFMETYYGNKPAGKVE